MINMWGHRAVLSKTLEQQRLLNEYSMFEIVKKTQCVVLVMHNISFYDYVFINELCRKFPLLADNWIH